MVSLRVETETLRRQAGRVADLSDENRRLSNAIAQANSSPPLSAAELSDVLKLRNEIGQLRRTLKEMDQLHREIDRIRDAAQRLTKDQDRGGDGPTALLADQMELRRARLGGLRQTRK